MSAGTKGTYENIGGGAATIGAWKIIADWSENASRENMAVPEKPKTLIRIDRAADEPFFPHSNAAKTARGFITKLGLLPPFIT